MGFADNVFDQKRGGRRDSGGTSMTFPHLAGKKRAIEPNNAEGPATPLRKLDLPTPEPDLSRVYMSREGSDFGVTYPATNLPPILPSVRSVTEVDSMVSPSDDRQHHLTPSTPGYGMNGGMNTLPPGPTSTGAR